MRWNDLKIFFALSSSFLYFQYTKISLETLWHPWKCFLKNHVQNVVEKLVPYPFLIKIKIEPSIEVAELSSPKGLHNSFLLFVQFEGYQNILKQRCTLDAFTSYKASLKNKKNLELTSLPTIFEEKYFWRLFYPAGNYMFKVSNRNTRARCEICSKLTIKIPERHFIVWLYFSVLASLPFSRNTKKIRTKIQTSYKRKEHSLFIEANFHWSK